MPGRRPINISATKTWRITALKRLNILTTGGTIDKIYYDDKSDYQIGEPEIARILKSMNVAFDWEIRALMRKDSLHLDDDDRALIRQAVKTSADTHFLITHGTDTMVETAAALGDVGERVIVMKIGRASCRERGEEWEGGRVVRKEEEYGSQATG